MTRAPGIVKHQQVKPEFRQRSRELRRTMTPAERVLWNELRGGKLAGKRFRRQQIIGGYIADFYCHEAGLVIELDGAVHEQQRDYDRAREESIRLFGLTVVRFTNDEILQQLPRVLETIRRVISGEGTKHDQDS